MLYDISELRVFSRVDTVSVPDMIDTFLEEAFEYGEIMRKGYATGGFVTVGVTAHCFKSSVNLFGMKHLLIKKNSNHSAFVKIKVDPLITRVSKFIRNTSIDELPQLTNTIKGDMSVVGNRPLPLYEAELLTSDQWAFRFLAPAGLTGLWQTKNAAKVKCQMTKEKALTMNML